jgi:hypothetical protein
MKYLVLVVSPLSVSKLIRDPILVSSDLEGAEYPVDAMQNEIPAQRYSSAVTIAGAGSERVILSYFD